MTRTPIYEQVVEDHRYHPHMGKTEEEAEDGEAS